MNFMDLYICIKFSKIYTERYTKFPNSVIAWMRKRDQDLGGGPKKFQLYRNVLFPQERFKAKSTTC